MPAFRAQRGSAPWRAPMDCGGAATALPRGSTASAPEQRQLRCRTPYPQPSPAHYTGWMPAFRAQRGSAPTRAPMDCGGAATALPRGSTASAPEQRQLRCRTPFPRPAAAHSTGWMPAFRAQRGSAPARAPMDCGSAATALPRESTASAQHSGSFAAALHILGPRPHTPPAGCRRYEDRRSRMLRLWPH
jgi:hypothetical protein